MTKCFLWLIISLIWLIYLPAKAQSFFPIKETNNWGAIDIQGKITITPSYEYIGDFDKNNHAIATKNNLSGIIDGNGKIIIPLQHQKIKKTSTSHYSIYKNEGCALANNKGDILTDFAYEALMKFSKGVYKTYKDTRFGLVNFSGKELAPVEYDNISLLQDIPGLILLESGKKKGLLSQSGEEIFAASYDEIEFIKGKLEARVNKAYTVVWLNADYSVREKKDFPNEMAKNLDAKAREKKDESEFLKNNPDARKPRWIYDAFRYKLANGVGQNLLKNKDFFDVGIDETLKRSLAREVIPPKDKGEKERIISYLIDHEDVKIIFSAEVKDMVISDFNFSEYARATADTLWDALIDKKGNIIRKIVDKPISNIGNFNSGLAWVKSGNTYGFINNKAQIAIPFMYQIVSDFENGYAIARKDGLFGCIDSQGKEVLPFIYDGIDIPNNGVCRVKKGKGRQGRWGAVNLKNKTVIPFDYSLIYPFKNGVARIRQGRNWGLISNTGKTILAPSIYCDFLSDFENGIAMVGMERWIEKTPSGPVVRYKKQGYIKEDGTYLIEPIYDKIENFEEIWGKQEGLCRIYKNNKVGYVNYQGIVELEAIYDDTYRFDTVWRNNTGISPVKKDGLFGYLDHNGKAILACAYQDISPDFLKVGEDSAGVAKVKKKGKYGFVNYSGKEVVPIQYEAASRPKNGVIPVKLNGKWGVVDTLDNAVLKTQYEGARFLDGSKGKLIELLKRGVSYYEIQSDGSFGKEVDGMPQPFKSNVFNKSPKYSYKSEFDANGFATIEKKGKLALVNSTGNLLTKFKYKEIHPFSDRLALVRLDAKERKDQLYGYINYKGEEVIAPQFKLAEDFSGGHAAILNRVNWGFIDTNGKTVIAPKFKQPGKFSDGYAIIDKKEIYDKNGILAGKFLLEGKISKGFQNNRAIIESTSGYYHITPKGTPAYFNKFDEVTSFIGKVAFVKKGEVWELTRKTGEYTQKLKFNRSNKNSYLATYGKNRKEKLQDGTSLEDLSWRLISNGTWKMIDTDGKILSDVVFTDLVVTETGKVIVKIENKLGLADLNGDTIAPQNFELIRMVSDEVVRLEKAGKIGYLHLNGNWLKKIE